MLNSGWTCPRCGRRFRQRTGEHSCEIHSVEAHLAGKPAAIAALFRALLAAVEACGPCDIEALKTMIVFRRGRNFAGAKVARGWIDLEFLLEHPLDSPRIAKYMALSPTRHAHTIRLTAPEQLDTELSGWISESWASAGE